jgi:uncharacterized protein (TIRG00374 family)
MFASITGLFGLLIHRLGYHRILRELGAIGWGLAAVAALELAISAICTVGWWFTFPRAMRSGSLVRLFFVRLAGSALNQTIPGASIGGEPVKVLLLRGRFPATLTAASIMCMMLAESLARCLFIMLGLLLALRSVRLGALPIDSLAAGFAFTALAVAAFMLLQIRGLGDPTRRMFDRMRHLGGWVVRIEHALRMVDLHLRELYRSRFPDFLASVALSLAALGVGVVQAWLLIGWLGVGRNWPVALAIESLSVLINFVFFFVPGSLGVQEGGKMLIFAALGLPVSAGLTLGIAFRLASLTTVAVGLLALPFLKVRQPDTGRDAAARPGVTTQAERSVA